MPLSVTKSVTFPIWLLDSRYGGRMLKWRKRSSGERPEDDEVQECVGELIGERDHGFNYLSTTKN